MAQDHVEDRILVNIVEKVIGELSKIGASQPARIEMTDRFDRSQDGIESIQNLSL